MRENDIVVHGRQLTTTLPSSVSLSLSLSLTLSPPPLSLYLSPSFSSRNSNSLSRSSTASLPEGGLPFLGALVSFSLSIDLNLSVVSTAE